LTMQSVDSSHGLAFGVCGWKGLKCHHMRLLRATLSLNFLVKLILVPLFIF
jgi:hypothetical protein